MQQNGDILDVLKQHEARAAKAAQQAVIIQPGALGDCILTLPLAEFIKTTLGPGRIDLISHTEYTDIFPGRTCVDGVRSIDSLELHRLFVKSSDFDLDDWDPLVNAFANYEWIITFLGGPDSDFEQNLIFTANCSHSAEVTTLQLKPPADWDRHICDFYIRRFVEQNTLCPEFSEPDHEKTLIKTRRADISRGRKLLKETGIDTDKKVVVIQPGSGAVAKSRPPEDFCWLAQQLHKKDFQVLFLLGPAELDRFSDSDIKGLESTAPCMPQLSLAEVLAVLSCAAGFIGNDSGPAHLAAGLGVKTLAIFGPTNPSVYKPIGPVVAVFKTGPEKLPQYRSALLQKFLQIISPS